MTRLSSITLLLCLATASAFAQASTTVRAGDLNGTATAGATSEPADRQVARGPRTDDTRNCDTRGVSGHNGNSSASASVTTSHGGSSVVAGGGSPGSHTDYFGCDAPNTNDRSIR